MVAGMRPWLFDRLLPLPDLFISFWFVLLLISFLSTGFVEWVWRFYQNRLDRLYSCLNRHPIGGGSSVVLTSALLFGWFGIQRIDSGDILEFLMAGWDGRAFLAEHAPLETSIRCWLRELTFVFPGLDIIELTKGLVCFYGGLYVWTILFFSSRQAKPLSILIPIFLLISPILNVYCAYLEIYGFTLIFQIVFLFTGLRYAQNRTSFTNVTFWFGLSLAAAFWHVLLFPAYGYLMFRAWRDGNLRREGLFLQALLLITPVLISLALLIPYANPFAGIVTRMSEPSVLIPLSHVAHAMGYGLFSKAHLTDWANEMLLVVFLPAALIVGVLASEFRLTVNKTNKPIFRFLALGASVTFLFGFAYFPILGFPLDWDLYTFMFPSVSLCGVVIMSERIVFRPWRKRLLVLVVAAAALSSAWILQNALFWRYPATVVQFGPIVSPFIPDFYFKKMNQAFENHSETHLYLLADRALDESPGRYRDILSFLDDWTISILAKRPPQPFDYPGWACDVACWENNVYIFDRWGRIFLKKDENLRWIFAPETQIDSPVVAADFSPDGSALLLCEKGQLLRIPKTTLETGSKEEHFWGTVEPVDTFLPDPPSARNMPVKMIDIAIKHDTQTVCVLDNFNRVWDRAEKQLLLEGDRSSNLARALHFTANHQPVTIDVNNRLSYNRDTAQFPFRCDYFHPIVRDFLLTHDEQGLMVLDLNGNVHYSGYAPMYEDVVQPGSIIDRYKKMCYLPSRDAILLLDNRYRLTQADIDPGGLTARNKIGAMIDSGNLTTAFNMLSTLWKKSSQFTTVCYDLLQTDEVRKMAGHYMYDPSDAIDLYVDLLPVNENLILLVDRWGRLVAENRGSLFLLEGTGLVSWPRTEVVDAALAGERVFFLCRDGTVWFYSYPELFGHELTPFERTPRLWGDLGDYRTGMPWIGIETLNANRELIAVCANGFTVRVTVDDRKLIEEIQLPAEGNALFDFDLKETGNGFSLAYTPSEGPARIFQSIENKTITVPNTDFGWAVITDVHFSIDDNIILLDRYGVIHQYNPILQLSEKPYTVIMDAAAFRLLPGNDKALWLRNNGEIRKLRVKQ